MDIPAGGHFLAEQDDYVYGEEKGVHAWDVNR